MVFYLQLIFILLVYFNSISIIFSNTLQNSLLHHNSTYKIEPVTSPVQHAEGPNWCDKTQTLYWVDTFEATLYRLLQNGNVQKYKLEGRNSVGFGLLIQNQNDTLLVFADCTIYRLYWPRDSKIAAKLETLMTIEENKPNNQFNDGKVDCKGRTWGGTLTRNEDSTVKTHGGSLYMFNNKLDVVEKISNTSISNGMAWSKDENKYYFIDSHTRYVVGYDFEADSGIISNRTTIFDLAKHPEIEGIPDGMTIDEDDNLWIALFGGSHILQVSPKTGKLLQTIKMPVTYITSLSFGGLNYKTLYVTTSQLHISENNTESLAGSIFAITNLGVKGLPTQNVILD